MKNQLKTIDNVYLNGLIDFYRRAEDIVDTIWHGMELSPVCIYRMNGPAFLYKHPAPPTSFKNIGNGVWQGNQTDLQLYGATPIKINGIWTATNYYGGRVNGKDEFFAELFHEMHHVYQINFIDLPKFENPALLPTYPEIIENEALKIKENEVLLHLLFKNGSTPFQTNLGLFYSIREGREKIIGREYMEYEKRVESVEGPAVYCEYNFLNALNDSASSGELWNILRYGKFFFPLTRLEFGRNNIRRRLLITGLVQCLILSKKVPTWKKEYFESDLLLNDFFFKKLPAEQSDIPDEPELTAYASYFANEERQKRQKRYTDFKNQQGVRIDLHFKTFPEFKGFDPMNVEMINDNILIHTMLKLEKGKNFLSFIGSKSCTKVKGNIWTVQSLFFFIDNKTQLKIKGRYISIDIPGKRMKWAGNIVSEKEKRITIELE